MYAVIKTGGKQYRVAADDTIKIEKLPGEAGESVTFDEVLMLGGESGVTVGEPTVTGASVAGEILDQARDRKIIIFKKKRRQTYRRKNGHRQHVTTVRITEILTDGKKPSKTATAKPKAKAETAKDAAPKAAEDTAAPLFAAPEGEADDLKKISGVGPVLEKKLNALGITRYDQIAAFTKEEIEKVDEVLNFKGRIEREDWIGQAATLAKGE